MGLLITVPVLYTLILFLAIKPEERYLTRKFSKEYTDYASRAAAYIREKSGIDATLDSKGRIGELTVWVEDKRVVTKGLFKFPDEQDVLEAVLKEMELQ